MLSVSSLVSPVAGQGTTDAPLESRSANVDVGADSTSFAMPQSDARAPATTPDARSLSEPAFSTRSSTTLGPTAKEEEVQSPEPPREQSSSEATAVDLEVGANPFYQAAPVTFGLGFGFRQVMTQADSIGVAARLGLTTALVQVRDERTGQETGTALWGGAPPFADLDLHFRLGSILRAGVGIRAGIYLAPRLYPLFAVGAGLAADLGRHRVELLARLQPLPTGTGNAEGSGEEMWTRTVWMFVPTLRVSLPVGK